MVFKASILTEIALISTIYDVLLLPDWNATKLNLIIGTWSTIARIGNLKSRQSLMIPPQFN